MFEGLIVHGVPVALDGRPPVVSLASAIPSYVSGLVTHIATAGVKTFVVVTVGAVKLNMPKSIAAETTNLESEKHICMHK